MFQEIPKNCRYGYARVSSKSQQDNSSLESQQKKFLELGVPKKNIRVEVGSAADTIEERPIFYHLIENELKENDLLFVTKIDRCSRNTFEFLKLQKKLHEKSVTFIALELPFSPDLAVNQFIATNLVQLLPLKMNVGKSVSVTEFKLLKKMESILDERPLLTKN